MRRQFGSLVTRFVNFPPAKSPTENLLWFDRAADLRGGASCCSSLSRRILFRMNLPFDKAACNKP
jgi:hypothetical protein